MPAPRVLISDALSPAAVQIFKDRGIEVDFQPDLGKDKDKLAAIIGDYDGLAIRSATKVTAKILEQAKNLKVIGRAGIGVDNVEIPAATAKGVIVMNTPFGNSITTAEHAIAMMFALARQIPQADASTQAGKWEKNRFMGVELTGKTLGVIGCGNIGSIVADRAIGLRMKVIAYDPFLSPERALEIGVEKVELDELLRRADIITLHVPMTEKTKNILSAENIAKTKKGVRIVNCARGGLVDEAALRAALDSGHVAGAAFDVFVEEPATEQPALRPSQRGLHAASGRRHHGGAGERGAAGGRADVGLPAPGRDPERGELPLDHRRGSAAPEALRGARRKARLLPRPAHGSPDQGHPHRVRGRGRRDEHPRAHLGCGDRRAAALPAGHQHGVGARGGARARHHGGGGQARERGARLRELHPHRRRRGGHAAPRRAAPCSRTASPASSRSATSRWMRSSRRT
jgi:phosphoglycerate dehydrogenase-like enzyme